eukprot:gene34447-41698_t
MPRDSACNAFFEDFLTAERAENCPTCARFGTECLGNDHPRAQTAAAASGAGFFSPFASFAAVDAPVLSVLKKPSQVDEEKFESHFSRGRLAHSPELISVMAAVCRSDESIMDEFGVPGRRILTYIPLKACDDFGLFFSSAGDTQSLPELTVSSAFHEQLLLELRSMPQFENKALRCLHQYKPDSSAIDVIVGEDITIAGPRGVLAQGTLPRLVIEVLVNEGKKKDKQLFAYVNNMHVHWPKGYQFVMLGATLLLSSSVSCVRLSGYYHSCYHASGHKIESQLSEVLLFEGAWNALSAGRVFAALQAICSVPMAALKLGVRRIPISISASNVAINETANVVTKVFDFRGASYHNAKSRRRYIYFLKYLDAKVIAMSPAQDLYIIQYTFITGTHVPDRVSHFISLMRQLNVLHSEEVVFGDLRLSNIVFCGDGESRLIDFDWTGREYDDMYPFGFNKDIGDGWRHEEAYGGNHLHRAHDKFSLAKIMERFAPLAADELCHSKWKEIAAGLISGDKTLEDAIEELQPYEETEVRTSDSFNVTMTGSPPRIVAADGRKITVTKNCL